MAKSFHDIIKAGKFEVKHGSNYATLDIPEVLQELDGILMDKELLLAWMYENDIEVGVIHAGIQKIIIDARAKARPKVNSKTGETLNILDDLVNSQARIDAFEIKPTLPPGSSKKPVTVDKAIAMAEGLSPEALDKMIANLQALQDKATEG